MTEAVEARAEGVVANLKRVAAEAAAAAERQFAEAIERRLAAGTASAEHEAAAEHEGSLAPTKAAFQKEVDRFWDLDRRWRQQAATEAEGRRRHEEEMRDIRAETARFEAEIAEHQAATREAERLLVAERGKTERLIEEERQFKKRLKKARYKGRRWALDYHELARTEAGIDGGGR